ncbi:hypothetical protein EGR_05412 [Echinococcus granulosus]|uniref:Uncharacterized protein n=1 Tax=Echinococcus granulosus TaxID=6210 RepID=W6UNF8_ECHGR|nr:hypothetical protein EGR_05412 [Echinococcus granulosus]EUB59792.1 hypothetical protein EGR_05412 [Echinococcus granulosus]
MAFCYLMIEENLAYVKLELEISLTLQSLSTVLPHEKQQAVAILIDG